MEARYLSILAVLAALALPATAGEPSLGPVPATVVRTVDGDTLEVEARPWLDVTIRTHVRLHDIDAPEIRGAGCPKEAELGRQAKAALAELVEGGDVLLLGVEPDKYAGRVLARVIADGADVGDELLRRKLAVPYPGQRASFCE